MSPKIPRLVAGANAVDSKLLAEVASEHATNEEEVILVQFHSVTVPVWPHDSPEKVRDRIVDEISMRESEERRKLEQKENIPKGIDRRHVVRRKTG
ncbi:hypothetical protein KW785_00350 [Candidatus Parcubacteria bacterium]|nr:hypothetical protein [Candidatus Parcubacteria bacterium]